MSSPIVPPPRSASSLAEAMVQTTSQASVLRRWGIVHAINGNATLNVDIAGVVIPNLKYVASYEPTVGERVLIDAVGTDLTVIGATAPSPRAYNRPTGDIEPTIRKTPKPDTLFLHGQTVKRGDYARLFAWVQQQGLLATATTPNLFGMGDGSTTFTLPDFRGRVLTGADETNPLGSMYGSDSTSFTIANDNLPQHTHPISINDHASHAHTASADNSEHEHSTIGSAHGGHAPHNNESGALVPQGSYYAVPTINYSGRSGGSHNHGYSGIHGHSVTVGGSGAFGHTASISNGGGVASPAAITTDVRQRAYAVNWMIWI